MSIYRLELSDKVSRISRTILTMSFDENAHEFDAASHAVRDVWFVVWKYCSMYYFVLSCI